MKQWIRGYDTRNDELVNEWLLHEHEGEPEFWKDFLSLDWQQACSILGKTLPTGMNYYLEWELYE